MTLSQFLLALRARRGVFFLSLAAVVLAAALASLLLPKSYKATAAVLVNVKDEQSMADEMRAAGLPQQEHLSYLQTQADILASPKVAHRVVDELKLAQNPATVSALGVSTWNDPTAGGRLEDVVVEQVLKGLKVETSQSDVIQATVTAADPGLAASIANGFVKAYLETTLELRVAPTREAAGWFSQQLSGLRANLEDAQQRLRAELKSRRTLVAQHPEGLTEVRDNSYISQLRADLSRGEAHLQQLSTQYGENYPDYQRQLSENRTLSARLQEEIRKVAASTVNSPNSGDLLRAGSGQQGTDALAPALAHNVESAEKAYDAALQRYYDSQVESRASKADATLLSAAVVPLRAYRPNILLNLALALITGTALGAALVAFMERQDARVRSVDDLLTVVPVPLLGVLGDRGARVGLLPRHAGRELRALPKPAAALPKPVEA